jgi:phospholipid/cholesterol/gamma-HCH transport system ATP-binding protein
MSTVNPLGKMTEFNELRFLDSQFGYDAQNSVFKNLTLDVPLNRNVFITGETGAGQSTFLKLLAVMLQPQSGHYFINGHDSVQMSFEDFLPIRMKIGYSFDYGGLFANRTLHDNLTFPLLYHKIFPIAEANEYVRQLAVDFEFSRQAHQRPANVSGGLRKLTCVLRAFIMNPEMIVLDDPFTGIGTDASRKLVRMIQDRRDAGQLKHVYMSSRDEVWPHWIGCDSLFINHDSVRFEERKAAS